MKFACRVQWLHERQLAGSNLGDTFVIRRGLVEAKKVKHLSCIGKRRDEEVVVFKFLKHVCGCGFLYPGFLVYR